MMSEMWHQTETSREPAGAGSSGSTPDRAMTPAELFLRCFAELERRGIPSVVLHSYESFPEQVASDVDCCVPDDRLAKALACIRETAERSGWALTQILQHEIWAFYLVLANPAVPEQWLKLDVCSHYGREGRRFLQDTELLHGRRPWRGFFIPCPSSECLYVWTKALAKDKDPQPLVTRLRELGQLELERTQALFGRVFGPQAGQWSEWLEQPPAEWQTLRKQLRQRNRPGLSQALREWGRRLRRIRHPTGLTLAFLGPDGAGKSTVIARLHPLLEPHFRRQLQVHFIRRPGAKADGGPVTEPHARPPRSPPASWAKILFYFVCAWLDWWVRLWPARVRSTCILCDRTFDDLLVDPRRYRVQRCGALVGLLRRWLPQPDVTFVLDAPTAVIQQRKVEVDAAETERQRAVLRELAAHDSRWQVVSTDTAPETVARTVATRVIEFLAARQRARWLHPRR